METYRFYQPIEIRYGDLDPQGHVNAARYLTFIEQARIAYLHKLTLWPGGSFLDIGVILADVQITYKAPMLWGQSIRVGTRIARLGTKSMDMIHCIEDIENGKVLALGKTVLVTYDYRVDQAIAIPEDWREKISVFEDF